MRRVFLTTTLIALFTPALVAAEGLSGTWTAGAGPGLRTFVFKVQGDRFYGIVCGPCDDPATVFRIEDGRSADAEHVAFFIRYDVGGPRFKEIGPYRDQVTATLAANQWTLRAQREGSAEAPVTTVLKRVVENYVGISAAPAPAGASARSAESKPSPLEGKWVAAGRVSQQNFILKVRDNKVWGLICGPCRPEGVFMIDEGTVDGDVMTFYINHLDTPPSAARTTGLNRNVMRGTISGNVMKFKWVREGAESEPGGEMVLIGPIR
jgi:hypothetical protein